jgi:hypothetical protein
MPTPTVKNPGITITRPRMFADGGQVQETSEELMARMAAKYGLTNPRAAQPVPVPQPQPQPAPQQGHPTRGGIAGAIDALKGRQAQIDKAAGYAGGGKIRGPGTATSDSIPARVSGTGEPIRVSTKERILSAAQDAFLGKLARAAGYDSLDQMLEDGTGKPVGPTIKAGNRAAATGMAPDDESKRDPFAYRPDPAATAPAKTPPEIAHGTSLSTIASSSLVSAPSDTLTRPDFKRDAFGPNQGSGDFGLTRPNFNTPSASTPAPAITDTLTPGKTGNAAVASYVNNPALMDKFNQQHAGSGITAGLDANGRPVFSGTGTPGSGGPERTPMEIYRSEAAMRGLDPVTFDRPGGGPGGGSIGNTSSTLPTIEMPAGLSGRQQANFLSQQQEIQAQLRGQDLTHGAAISGQAVEGQRQARLADHDAVRLGLDARLANQADQRLGLETRRLDQAADRDVNRGGPTLAQQRGNFEIDAARDRVTGLTPEDIKNRTAPYSATGRENPDFDPTLAKSVALSNRRKVGTDPQFDAARQAAAQAATQEEQRWGDAEKRRGEVRDAILRGADPSKVAERIRSMGGNPGDYGL